MLLEAIAAKKRELGRYPYRQLEEDSGVSFSYVSKAKRGKVPSREILLAWSEALAPHFPYDEALVQAGYLPDDDGIRQIVRGLMTATSDVRRRVERELGFHLFTDQPKHERTSAMRRQSRTKRGQQRQGGDTTA